MGRNKSDWLERFLAKFEIVDDCWTWVGARSRDGLSGIFYVEGKWRGAHRVAHELFSGPIGDFEVRHVCGNRLCVNPEHLVLRALECRSTPEDVARRFWSKVDRRGDDECWPWQGGRKQGEYGTLGIGKGRHLAHRVAYKLTHGAIPDGLVVRHDCDNPPCCNPAHLRAGTQADNLHDMDQRGRRRYGPRRLTRASAELIRARYARGDVSQEALAAEYGVTQPAISRTINGFRWRNSCQGT